ncbi:MAG: 2-hydroxyglutaryl-CoA dehydratase [Myxococcota bacterium]|nr:2-hydroxyglutaryl-CoA dehydratase [Myxococcota bacterium]
MSQHEDSEAQSIEERIAAELGEFAAAEATKLGLDRDQWVEPINTTFTRSQRETTTMLVSGLTLAHDTLVCAAFENLGYKVAKLDAPDNAALQFGKEFGNRAQCNPTYYTVGNLVKHLVHLRDNEGMEASEIIEKYLFVTAGACGPCRFGTYVTEYRKALRDAGFDGFRVMLFQQQGGMKQATGEELGLEINQDFILSIVKSMLAGDVLNLMGYRLRPYELEEGATDRAIAACRAIMVDTLSNGKSIVMGLLKCRRELSKVLVDRSQPKPLVSIIGEFWAMTTEGEGNYELQTFLESEGAEVDIQPIVNWLLFMVWENTFDTELRIDLKEDDVDSKKGLKAGTAGATKKLWTLRAADKAIRSVFQTFAHAVGLYGYHLPDMTEIAELAAPHYDNNNRGGEAHMEVGKLIHFVEDKVNHMTVSVKPFGCMPSSGVSDGVQSIITAKWPEAIFLPIETTGDGKVNVHSRIQMMLFKARQKAKADYERALQQTGMDEHTFKAKLSASRWGKHPFRRPPHREAGVATNLVYAIG